MIKTTNKIGKSGLSSLGGNKQTKNIQKPLTRLKRNPPPFVLYPSSWILHPPMDFHDPPFVEGIIKKQ